MFPRNAARRRAAIFSRPAANVSGRPSGPNQSDPVPMPEVSTGPQL